MVNYTFYISAYNEYIRKKKRQMEHFALTI